MSRLTYVAKVGSVLAVLACLVAATGCAPSDPPPGPSVTSPTGTAARPPALRTAAERDCGTAVPADVEIVDTTIKTSDGVRLRAAILGAGSRGVVMLHQTNDGLCGWLPYASQLAGRGFRVAVFDRRCTFGSSCVAEPAAYDFIGDVEAVMTAVRGRGVGTTALVGASFGGAIAIGACAALVVKACIAVSPAQFDNYLGGGITANNAIGRVRTPLLVAVAPDDASSPVDSVNTLTRRARPGVVTSVALPTGGAHGWDTLVDPLDPDQPPTPFSTRLVAFLDKHLP